MRRNRARRQPPGRRHGTNFVPPARWRENTVSWWAGRTNPIDSTTPAVGTVLVAVDGTPFGEHALPLAAVIARQAGAGLRVVHVVPARELAGEAARVMADARWVLDQRRRRGEYLDGLVRRLARAYPLPVSGALLDGADVAEPVCEATATADLLVIATRKRGPWSRFWWGSVTAAVARRARCPVLLVRGRDDPPGLSATTLPREILVPLDGTDRGEEAVRAAVKLGSLAGARYDLLHVVSAWAGSALPARERGSEATLPGEMAEADARSYLRRVTGRLVGEGGATVSVVVDDRPVAEAIAGYAERTGAELIVLATRGRGPLSRFFRGSVAEEVASRACVPVLLTNTCRIGRVAGGQFLPAAAV